MLFQAVLVSTDCPRFKNKMFPAAEPQLCSCFDSVENVESRSKTIGIKLFALNEAVACVALSNLGHVRCIQSEQEWIIPYESSNKCLITKTVCMGAVAQCLFPFDSICVLKLTFCDKLPQLMQLRVVKHMSHCNSMQILHDPG